MYKVFWVSLAILALAADGCFHSTLFASTTPPVLGSDWPTVGGDYKEQHFSPLVQITTRNISKLGLAWSLDLPGEHGLQATPLAVGGVLYFSGQLSKVYAVDAATGWMLWTYDPETSEYLSRNQRFMFPANRGVAYWNGKIFVGTLDGRLVAIDAKSGKFVWSVPTLEPGTRATLTGAPRAFNGKVIIGQGGGDFGYRGYVTAFDSENGNQLWRFYIVPGDPSKGFENEAMAMAAKTWTGAYWKTGTGGGPWNSLVYDHEMNRVYIGTGNAGPWNPAVRSPNGGDNLFISSIVAVDADTGKYVWHYQTTPGEGWDFKATADIELAHIVIDGQERSVLMQSPTNGFFYVIDRETGKLISAEKTGKVTWAERVDLVTGRPVEIPNARYVDGPVTFWPSTLGTHNWQAMSYSPQTGLAYIPYMKAAVKFEPTTARPSAGPHALLGLGVRSTMVKIDEDDITGQLLAWDPVTQKKRWSVPRDKMWNGGVLSTAGNLVFQGDANGTFHAYDARNGKSLWQFDAKLGIVGAPISYTVGDRQFIAILVGFGGSTGRMTPFQDYGWKYGAQPRRLLNFALNATAKLPPTEGRNFEFRPLDDPKLVIDDAAATTGERLYSVKACFVCHGENVRSGGNPGPELQESGISLHYPTFVKFLRTGTSAPMGMPKYDEITDKDSRDIFMYIRATARKSLSQ